jgi:hypothetical protein
MLRAVQEIDEMASNIQSIADKLGAKVVGQVPEAGGGTFGAARLTVIVAAAQGNAGGADHQSLGRKGSDTARLDYEETGRR